jgi:hypothetical protein
MTTSVESVKKSKSIHDREIEFVGEYSGVLTESDMEFIADLFARAIIERMKRTKDATKGKRKSGNENVRQE